MPVAIVRIITLRGIAQRSNLKLSLWVVAQTAN